MKPLVRLDGIGVSLGGRPVLRDVDLEVAAGESVGISGPNGSGKTTAVRLIATLLRPESGHGEVLDRDLGNHNLHEIRRHIGLIGHTPALIPELSLRENLRHFGNLAGVDEERIEPVLDVVGLARASDRRAEASSFGMKRRIEVALLLLRRPKLVLFDEATSGLDSAASALIDAVVEATTEAGGGVVMVSHDSTTLAGTCSRQLTIGDGRLETVR